MFYHFNELIKSGSVFWFCALTGSGMFFIQFIINIFSGTNHDNFDAGDTTNASNNSADARNFKWFSMQAITGFLMMFGWTAITCQREFGLKIFPRLEYQLHQAFLQLSSFALFLNMQKNFKVLEALIELKMLLVKRPMFISPFQKTGSAKSRFHCKILPMKLMPFLTILKHCPLLHV